MKEKDSILGADFTHTETIYERVLAEYQREGKDPKKIKPHWFALQPRLVICGGGHVAKQVVRIAKMVDFYVQVIDDREEFANPISFPEADEVCCHDYGTISDILPTERNVYYVVVTRGHAGDQICVEQILRRPYEYLGMIGSKAKVAKTYESLEEAGFDPDQVHTIHAPIGLPIKAQTPAEIAVSIMAEVILHKNSKAGSTMTQELNRSQEGGTLCIITDKTGSSPRSVGSMMLVKKDGSIIGSIGGGILEHQVILRAQKVTEITDEAYVLSDAEGAELGMICGGTNQVTLIPLLG